MTYTEELMAGNPRHPADHPPADGREARRPVVGARLAGALELRRLRRPQARADASTSSAGIEAAGRYRIPNLRMDSRCVYTNQLPGGFMRSPGQPQMAFAVESQMDIIAEALGIDPVELRRAQRDPRRATCRAAATATAT